MSHELDPLKIEIVRIDRSRAARHDVKKDVVSKREAKAQPATSSVQWSLAFANRDFFRGLDEFSRSQGRKAVSSAGQARLRDRHHNKITHAAKFWRGVFFKSRAC